jgi:hypothetical protein
MGAFRRVGWLKIPLAGAAAWVACGLTAAALAQSPTRIGVEVWYGLERVSDGQEAPPPKRQPAPPKPASGATIAPGSYVLPAAGYPFTPNTPPPVLLPSKSAFLPDAGHSVVPTVHWSEDRPGGRLDNTIHDGARGKKHVESPRRPDARSEAKAEKLAAPTPAVPSAGAQALPAAEGKGENSHRSLYQFALVQLLSVVGSLVVGPLVLLLALLFVLRRFKAAGSLLRVEVVNSGTPAPTILYGGPAAWPAPVPAAGGDGAEVRLPVGVEALTKEPEVETTAQPLELGPTYEEERRQREEAERQREQAVLQYVYEDNVRLREQLEEGPAAEAPVAGVAVEGEAVPA